MQSWPHCEFLHPGTNLGSARNSMVNALLHSSDGEDPSYTSSRASVQCLREDRPCSAV